jgi:hypothetical protein
LFCRCSQKAEVGLGGDEPRATPDCLDLTRDVTVAAAAGEAAVCLGRTDDAILGRDNIWMVLVSRSLLPT